MNELKVKIVAFVDDWNPGWVKCSFNDVYGILHSFDEKVPVVTTEWLDAQSEYPKDGFISCQILNAKSNVVTIDISNPLGIETADGRTIFEIYTEQLNK